MKIYVQTDIEGIAGFCFFENRSNPGLENFNHIQRMRRLLTNEVNSAVKSAFDSGADEVYVNDSHGSGYSIIFEDLEPECRIIHGRKCSGPHWLPLLDDTFDAMVLVGMHAMGGMPKALVPHSKWEINNGEMFLSEGSMAAAIAGDHGVPTVFVSGDDCVVAEISEKIPGIESVITKEALSPYQACSLVPAKACDLIYNAVKVGIKRRRLIEPFKINGPIRLNLLDSPTHQPPFEYCGETVSAETVDEAFMRFENKLGNSKFNSDSVDGFEYP